MKIMKRAAALIMTLCLVFPMYSIVSRAADGTITFTDPETKTGETVEVACALRTNDGGALESFDVTLKYDPAFLAFESGDGVTKVSSGVLKYSGTGDGSGKIRFTMQFQALQVGTTKIEITESSGTVPGGESVTCKNGNSTIQIAQGTNPVTKSDTDSGTTGESTGGGITVGDKSYTLSDAFQTSDIPVGFTETTLTLEGAEHKIVQNENGAIKLGYLVDSEGKGDFFLYNEEDATFSPYVQITVSPAASIVLLSADDVKVPSGYQQVKLTVNEHEFPAWQDKEHEGFYLLYAMNSEGEKGFYQYDTQEESYQRYVAADTASDDKDASKVSKLNTFIEEHLSLIVLCTGLGILVLLIVIIVLAVKLRHRNLELDDLYEEYDMDGDDMTEDEDGVIRLDEDEKAEKRSQFKRQPKEEDDFLDDEDTFDDYYEDDYYEDDEESGESDNYLDDEDFGFDFDDDDDDFDVDFIDLD